MTVQDTQWPDSLWRSTAEPAPDFDELNQDIETDLLIVGAGYTGLSTALHAVDHAKDGEEGLHLALTEPYDAAVIDLMLPKRDGLSVIERMRTEKVNTPVIAFLPCPGLG